MAEALESLYPGVKFGIGPPIEAGFYYDIDLPEGTKISSEDLPKIEEKMRELVKANNEYKRIEIDWYNAVAYFKEKGDEYKLELLDGLKDSEITFYTQGNFTDLCRGTHVPSTGFIKFPKLLSVAGAYWRGDSSRKQLTRIYGIAFPKKDLLEEFLKQREEAEKTIADLKTQCSTLEKNLEKFKVITISESCKRCDKKASIVKQIN
jgi:threonyl-tRNA synthetase